MVAGGLGVGKTTFVGSISEIMPLTTEAVMTDAAAGLDNLAMTPLKSTTTVALDFGRVSLGHDVILHLFGTPGQNRFWFMWDDLIQGAIGAVVLVDTRRLADSFAPIDYFEQRQLPFLIGVNDWDGHQLHADAEVRDALTLAPHIPLVRLDARSKDSAKDTLIHLVEHVLASRQFSSTYQCDQAPRPQTAAGTCR